MDFIRKVYGILSVQLALTFGGVIMFTGGPQRIWLQSVSQWVALPCFAAAIFIEMMLICCCRHLSKQVPTNYALLFAFTAFFSFPIWMMTVRKTPGSTIVCVGATFALTLALTMYACCTKTDITMCYGLMIAMCVISVILIVATFFMTWVEWWHPFVSAILLLFYAFYLIYDT